MVMNAVRPFLPADLEDLYAISLATGHLGGDASDLYAFPEMIGHIYAAPYAVLAPSLGLVATDALGVAGFVLGATDTVSWENRLERDWWPALRSRYADPDKGAATDWTADQRRAHMIHHPAPVPLAVSERYPAHVHMNLLPRLQGVGAGARLLQAWYALAADRGVTAVHVGVNRGNGRAVRFWQRSGFSEIGTPRRDGERTMWMGKDLAG
jgi:GNAT superfamily N-acetyltransferase